MNDSGDRNDMKFFMGLIVGGLVGAGAVFLLGTKEGKKVQKMIREKGEDLVEDVGDQIAEFEKKGKELAKQGEALKEQFVEQIEEKKEDLTVEATKKLDEALANIEDIQEKGLSTTATLRKRLFKNLPKKG